MVWQKEKKLTMAAVAGAELVYRPPDDHSRGKECAICWQGFEWFPRPERGPVTHERVDALGRPVLRNGRPIYEVHRFHAECLLQHQEEQQGRLLRGLRAGYAGLCPYDRALLRNVECLSSPQPTIRSAITSSARKIALIARKAAFGGFGSLQVVSVGHLAYYSVTGSIPAISLLPGAVSTLWALSKSDELEPPRDAFKAGLTAATALGAITGASAVFQGLISSEKVVFDAGKAALGAVAGVGLAATTLRALDAFFHRISVEDAASFENGVLAGAVFGTILVFTGLPPLSFYAATMLTGAVAGTLRPFIK